jgi:hypothetical protein|nr:MAG TPA: hypothetical protein [Caudoviricetes sp.]
MNEQQLIKTIEDQNQVIIAKDATIELLRNKLKDAKCELNELYLDRSWQKMEREYLTEAMWQKSVKVIGGFEYGTRYIPVHLCVTLNIAIIAFGLFMLSTMGAFK